ncbi:MAG TPA: glutamate racemase [Cellvibrionaceae bacterium]
MSAPDSPLHFNSHAAGRAHHILVFDSGLGGLSVAREIIRAQPQCQISYVADTAYFPYGTKTDAELITRIEMLIEQALVKLAPDLIVIACNTASTLALSHLRSRFAQPFVGVVPAIKPAAALSLSKTIGVLATPATVNRPYTAQLISDFAGDCRVLRFGSQVLVAMAEASLCSEMPLLADVQKELAGLISQPQGAGIDTIVLACTHFPLLADTLKQAAPHIIHWVDSGAAVARQVGVWLERLPSASGLAGPVEFYSTKPYEHLQVQHVQTLLGRELIINTELFSSPENSAALCATHVKN